MVGSSTRIISKMLSFAGAAPGSGVAVLAVTPGFGVALVAVVVTL